MIQTKASAVPSRFSSSYYSACKMAVKMPHLNTSQTSLKLAGWKKKMDIFIESEQGARRNISSGRLQVPEDYGEAYKDSL